MAAKKVGSKSTTTLAEVEARIIGGIEYVGELTPLLTRFTTAVALTKATIAEARCLRSIFKHYWQKGALYRNALAADKAGSKRKRDEGGGVDRAAGELTQWLRTQFFTFLEQLLRIIAWPEDSSEAQGTHAAAQHEAVDSIMSFTVLACSREQQLAEHGSHVNNDVVLWLLRHLLSVDTSSSATSSVWTKAQRRLLAEALHTFRTSFCDEFDDVRFYTFRAIASAARSVSAGLSGAREGAKKKSDGDSAPALPADAASIAALAACPPVVFVRNAAALLLAISLPPSEAEWVTASHRSLVSRALKSEAVLLHCSGECSASMVYFRIRVTNLPRVFNPLHSCSRSSIHCRYGKRGVLNCQNATPRPLNHALRVAKVRQPLHWLLQQQQQLLLRLPLTVLTTKPPHQSHQLPQSQQLLRSVTSTTASTGSAAPMAMRG